MSSDESTGASYDMTTVTLGTDFQLGKKWWEHTKNPLCHDLSSAVLKF